LPASAVVCYPDPERCTSRSARRCTSWSAFTPGKLAHVRTELEALRREWGRPAVDSGELARLTEALRTTNEALWEVEDRLRLCEGAKDFGPEFVELARAVYRNNDERNGLKRRVSELLGSAWCEQKSYPAQG
jgi:hypothetical protein